MLLNIDDAYLGGEKPGKRGRGAASKTPFVTAIQTNSEGKPHFMRLTPVVGFTHEALKQWSTESLASTAHVVSDGLWCLEAVTHTTAQHERHIVGNGKLAVKHPEFHWVNTLLGNLKTALSGTYHAFNHVKYAHRYLAEFTYRFNRRFDLAAMVPRLLRAAVTTSPLPLNILRVSEASN